MSMTCEDRLLTGSEVDRVGRTVRQQIADVDREPINHAQSAVTQHRDRIT
jgi:hypothetical protein